MKNDQRDKAEGDKYTYDYRNKRNSMGKRDLDHWVNR